MNCNAKVKKWSFKDFSFKSKGNRWMGVDILNEDVADNMEKCVWEPSLVKINALSAASEATCLILSVDETIKNPKSGEGPAPPGRGRR
jgi:T-complex protein 1 subunit eta